MCFTCLSALLSLKLVVHIFLWMIDFYLLKQSKEEYEASVCLCGSQVCRGSYLNLTGAYLKVWTWEKSLWISTFRTLPTMVGWKPPEISFVVGCRTHLNYDLFPLWISNLPYGCLAHQVLKECHGVLDRQQLMLEACELNSVSEEDYLDLGRAGLGSCLLGGLPDWLVAYSARLVCLWCFMWDVWIYFSFYCWCLFFFMCG